MLKIEFFPLPLLVRLIRKGESTLVHFHVIHTLSVSSLVFNQTTNTWDLTVFPRDEALPAV